MRNRYILRWLLVVPAAVGAWYFVFVVGIFTHAFLEEALSPAGEMESGMRMNRRVQFSLQVEVTVQGWTSSRSTLTSGSSSSSSSA